MLRMNPDYDVKGLSPHIRGNEGALAIGIGVIGSIPAHTGERIGVASAASFGRVYPRTYGGTPSPPIAPPG